MASFQIFEDQNREKENVVTGTVGNMKVLAGKNQDKRPTLAVLNNVLNDKQRDPLANNDKLVSFRHSSY